MYRILMFALSICFLVLGLSRSNQAQDQAARTPISVASESGNREQDGLIGPVRRVRAETARIMAKDGKMVEGPRVLRSVTMYDPKGQRIDSVAYPVESTSLPGREQYEYDSKGNIVKMVLRGDDGSILTKENYEYEFDELGNWKKMTSSVALYENGKVSYEPIEVTYRTITYYYGQAVDKLATSAPKPQTSDRTAGAEGIAAGARVAASTSPRRLTAPVNKVIKEDVVSPAAVSASKAPLDESATPGPEMRAADDESPVATSEKKTIPDEAPTATKPDATLTVRHVAADVLRGAAIKMPKPEYPSAAGLARASGKVEVHVIVGDKGEVVTARAMSGHPLLIDAAEKAARKASFSRAKLSPDPGRIYGVLTYDFGDPAAEASSAAPSSAPSNEKEKNRISEEPTIPISTTPLSSSLTNEASTETNSSEPAAARYQRALTYLSPSASADGVAALREAIQLNPNDGLAYKKLGLAYSGQGQNKEAIAVFKMAIRISPELLDAEGYHHLGHAYLALGKHSDALSAFKQALYISRAEGLDPEQQKIQKSPSPAELHYSLGLAYHSLGRYREAIKEMTEVITLNPKLAEGYYGLGVAYISIGDRRSAEKQQRTLVSLNPALADKIAVALSRPMPTPGCRTIACR